MKRISTIALAIIMALILDLTSFTNAYAMSDEIPLPLIIQEFCREVGDEFGICPCLLMSIVYQETRGTGENLTQITSTNWYKEGIDYCDAEDYKTNSYSNIRVCGYYIAKWYEELGDVDSYLVVDCWNKGYENAIASYNASKPSYYARTIIDRSAEWEDYYYSNRDKNEWVEYTTHPRLLCEQKDEYIYFISL